MTENDLYSVVDTATIDEMINEIAAIVAQGLPGTLPEVTTTENGKIMKVVNGEWALAADAVE